MVNGIGIVIGNWFNGIVIGMVNGIGIGIVIDWLILVLLLVW